METAVCEKITVGNINLLKKLSNLASLNENLFEIWNEYSAHWILVIVPNCE